MSYLPDNVFLTSSTAQWLYHDIAKDLPIIDFHTHLPQGEIDSDHRFEDLWELWLKHDHYKWRLMRACGVSEKFITGDASPKEKFLAFAGVMPLAIGNPVHQWAHLELKRVFGIDLLLNQENAEAIWQDATAQLQNNKDLSVRGLLERFKVQIVCTTDDPAACLDTHKSVNSSEGYTKAYPTFRPDNAINWSTPTAFRDWIASLSKSSGLAINTYVDLVGALKNRHQYFHDHGCRLSDHGLPYTPAEKLSEGELNHVFIQAMGGATPDPKETEAFSYDILKNVAKWNTEKGWTMQLHLGPQRNVNTTLAAVTGRDSGYDTMGSWPQTPKLIETLNSFEQLGILGKTIVYNLNPVESEPICCALQNFQNDNAIGLIQYGPAWWHLDHARGIKEQLDILTNLGAVGTSVGMLTDSRSFTSYVRHEYFRRLLCQYIGERVDSGEIPNEKTFLSNLIADICYNNAANYFNWSQ